METSLPTPTTARVYVNLPEGKSPFRLKSKNATNLSIWIQHLKLAW